MPFERIEGLIPAPFTPMHADGSLHLELIPAYYRLLHANGIRAVFICGTTGEGESMTLSERKAVAEAWADAASADPQFKVMTMVGGTCIQDCIELALHAKATGLYAVSLLAPYFFKPATADHLLDYCAAVAGAVPEMPFYYYHIPVMTQVNFPMIGFLEKAAKRIPNFAGIKYSNEDHMDLLSCLQYSGNNYDIFWGRDENLLSAMAMGARAAIGSTYNYIAPLYHDLIKAFLRNDLPKARELQQISVDLIRLLGRHGGIPTGKAYMKMLGLDLGGCRMPNRSLDDKAYAQLVEEAQAIGFDACKSV